MTHFEPSLVRSVGSYQDLVFVLRLGCSCREACDGKCFAVLIPEVIGVQNF